ncbi:MAG TPA: SAM-dependent methyltransferase [Thermoanaerobaculia bacterium]|nr:SAM-dependent methyltransferase [Thermoanaerobaculia bacterium]
MPLIRNVSDTARWVAAYRAMETARPDALFRDPFADRLAGERGRQIVRELPRGEESAWAMAVRTVVFDEMILAAIERGADAVLNLAAGFDARPYRLPLRPDFPWFEADLPPLLAEKEEALAGEIPVCRLERRAVDLADREARSALFAEVAAAGKNVFVLSEGLITYLTADQVKGLARDLHAAQNLRDWAFDMASPLLLKLAQRTWSKHMTQAPLRFAPSSGERFFSGYGWRAAEIRYSLDEGERLNRRPPVGRFAQASWRLMPEALRRPFRKMGKFVRLERV